MARLLAVSAALMAGWVYAGPWDEYSESGSTAFHRDYSAESRAGVEDRPGVGGVLEGHDDREMSGQVSPEDAQVSPWDDYSERDSSAFSRDFLRD